MTGAISKSSTCGTASTGASAGGVKSTSNTILMVPAILVYTASLCSTGATSDALGTGCTCSISAMVALAVLGVVVLLVVPLVLIVVVALLIPVVLLVVTILTLIPDLRV